MGKTTKIGEATNDKNTWTTDKYRGTISWTRKRTKCQVRTLHKLLRWFAWDIWLPLVQSLIFCHLL